MTAPWAFVLMWSSGAIFAELGLRYAAPFAFLAIRATLSAAIAWAVGVRIRDVMPADASAWRRTIGVGLVMQGGYQAMFFLSLHRGISAGTLAAVLGMQPLLTGMFTAGRRAPWTGLAIGLAGLFLVVADTIDPEDFTASAGGVVAAVGALLCMTFGTIAQQRLTGTGLWSSIAIQQSAASGLFVPLALATGQTTVVADPRFWAAAAWMVIVVSTGATALLFVMVRQGNPTRVSSLFYLVPPVTALLDLVVYGHALALPQGAGTALVVLALLLVRRTHTPPAQHNAVQGIDRGDTEVRAIPTTPAASDS
ncbi:MAG: DMT family transporter [Kineosporiaceae bacterium]